MNDIDVSTCSRRQQNGGGKPDFSRISTIDGLDVKGKRVLVRVDFNVPMQDGDGRPTPRASSACCRPSSSSAGGAKVIVLSHLGRPKTGTMKDTTLNAIADKIAELMPGTQGDTSSTTASARRPSAASMR